VGRIVAGFGLLMVVLIAITVPVLRWSWPMLQAYRLAPRVAFAAAPALPADAWQQPAMWLARPDLAHDPARYLPPGIAHERSGRAYVFFVHPTTFLARNHWNAPIDHADSRMRAELAVRSMASVFNDEAGIWAPRYRQAALGTFLVDRPEAKQALAVAEGDARAAFATFVQNIPPGAPIILAGHSQGALITLHLLRDMVRGTPLAPRVVAVYLTGWRVSPRHDVPLTGMPACTRADQAGCIMAWMTFADPADPRQVLAMAAHYPALDGTYDDSAPLCTNPLTGGMGSIAPGSVNLGSLATGDELRRPALVLPSVGARCDPASGVLLVSAPPHLGDEILPGNNFTMYDFALFWRNLRADVAGREAVWLREHHLS
jgi:hypothetical protein